MISGPEENVKKQEDEIKKQTHLQDEFSLATSTMRTPKGPQFEPTSGCSHNGVNYLFEEEFFDNCDQFCVCVEKGEVFCNPIKCPSEFGLDVINPFCLEWEKHDDFVPKPPTCCPPVPKCLSDGSCEYKGEKFKNYDNIPANLTGIVFWLWKDKAEKTSQKNLQA